MTLCLTSCGSNTTYRPEILGHDYMRMELVKPKKQGRISCGDPQFEMYASVHLNDLKKLALILKKAKLPRHVRLLVEELNKEVEVLETKGLVSNQSP